MALLFMMYLLGAAPTVSLSADSSCAPREVLRQELGATFSADGVVVLRLEKNGELRLEREGKVVLSRSLGSGSCDELGRAAAVVVVRWVQQLMHPVKIEVPVKSEVPVKIEAPVKKEPAPAPVSLSPAGERVDAPLPVAPEIEDAGYPLTPTLSPVGEREPVEPVETVVVVDAGVPSPFLRTGPFEILAGGGLNAPGAPDVAPVISLDLALFLNDHFRIDLAGLFDFGGSVNVRDEAGLIRGALATRGGSILPGAAYCFLEPVRLCFGALAGLRIVEGASSGTFVFNDTTSRVTAFVFGPNAQLAFIRGPFFLALDVSLLVTPRPPVFEVQGLPTQLRLPLAQGLFRLSVGFGSSP